MKYDQIMEAMRVYIKDADLAATVDDLETQKVTDVLASSLDVVEFVMELEERLGLDEELDINQLAPKLATLTFQELAKEVEQFLAEATVLGTKGA
jgi:acyl carrier protein